MMDTGGEQLWILASVVLAFGCGASLLWALAPAWDRVAARQVRDLTPRLIALRMDTRKLPYWMRLWGASLFAVILVLGVILQMWPLMIAGLLLLYIAPRWLLERMILQRRRNLRDQMVSATSGIANAVRAGLSLAQGIESVTQETPQPLCGELRRIVFEWHCGRPLLDAIDEVRRRLDLDGFTLFALALSACIERGGNVSEALDRISRSLLENQRLERKLESDTASGRKVVVILAMFPLMFLGLFMMLDPIATSLMFSTLAGQVVLLIVIGIVYGSVVWCGKILKIEI